MHVPQTSEHGWSSVSNLRRIAMFLAPLLSGLLHFCNTYISHIARPLGCVARSRSIRPVPVHTDEPSSVRSLQCHQGLERQPSEALLRNHAGSTCTTARISSGLIVVHAGLSKKELDAASQTRGRKIHGSLPEPVSTHGTVLFSQYRIFQLACFENTDPGHVVFDEGLVIYETPCPATLGMPPRYSDHDDMILSKVVQGASYLNEQFWKPHFGPGIKRRW